MDAMALMGWVGAVGALCFVVVFTIDGWTRPGYRPSYHPVSALALSSRGWMQRANFITCGAALAVGSVSMIDVHILLAVAIGAFGLGLIASGVFSMDPMRGYPPGTPAKDPPAHSRHHLLHDYAGMVVFAAVPVAAGIATFSPALDGPLRVYSAITAVAAAAGFIGFGQAWERDAARAGVWQRLTILVGWTWVAVILVVRS